MMNIPHWVKHAVFYQIFPDRFARSERVRKPAHLEAWDSPPTIRGFKGGDLLGVKEHLDYLEDLGVTALYFNPIFQSSANHRYHTHDYYNVDPLLGGDAAFDELLDAAHARGLRVILDGVFNHTGRGFLQFNHLLENGKKAPYFDWFYVKDFPLNAYNDKPANYCSWWNNRELPKLNTDNPQVREFLFDVAEYWLHKGVDGWRLDVPLEIKTPGFWEEFRRRVRGVNSEAYILAEIWDEAGEWLQGEHFDALMNYPFNRACLGFFGGEKLNTDLRPGGFRLERLDAEAFSRRVYDLLTRYRREVTAAQFNLLSSHDEPRFLTMVDEDKQRLRLATLFQMTFVGAPSIYYGDEIGMVGGEDPDCRRTFSWDEDRWDKELLADFRRYTCLRHEHPVLRNGEYVELLAENRTYAFARHSSAETLVIVCNVGNVGKSVTLDLAPLSSPPAAFQELWTGATVSVEAEALNLHVDALSARVLRA